MKIFRKILYVIQSYITNLQFVNPDFIPRLPLLQSMPKQLRTTNRTHKVCLIELKKG